MEKFLWSDSENWRQQKGEEKGRTKGSGKSFSFLALLFQC